MKRQEIATRKILQLQEAIQSGDKAAFLKVLKEGYTLHNCTVGDSFLQGKVIKILHGLRGLDIIGADIVCLMPAKDNPSNITSMTAMVLMFEQIALIADGIRDSG